MSSKRQRIIEALVERLRAITTTNGFATDAGLYLYWGPVVLGPDDPPEAIAIVPSITDTTLSQPGKKIITLPVQFHAVVQHESPQLGTMENSWLRAEAVLSDIKRAVELADPTFAGLVVDFTAGEVDPLVREEGGTILGLRIEYRVVYTEKWGAPEV